MSNRDKKEIKSLLLSIVMWSCFLVFATIFWYMPRSTMVAEAAQMASGLSREGFYLEELNDGFQLNNIFPTTDEVGVTQKAYAFQIVNDLDFEVNYALYFQNDVSEMNDSEEALPNYYLRYQLVKNGEAGPIANLNTDGKILLTKVEANAKDTYELRVWLDQNADAGCMNKVFIGRLGVNTL